MPLEDVTYIVVPQSQSSRGLILNKNITSRISIEICQVDAHTRPWDGQGDGDAMAPIWWGMNVLKEVGRVGVAIHVDPDVIITPAACHVAIENPVAWRGKLGLLLTILSMIGCNTANLSVSSLRRLDFPTPTCHSKCLLP